LAYEQLSLGHPGLIFGEISAFGTAGTDATRPGLDVIVSAASGLTISGRGLDDGVPAGSEAYLTDYMAGMTLAFGVVTALRERDRTGRGQKVTTSLLQASFTLQTATANIFEAFDAWKRPFLERRALEGTTLADIAERRTHMPGNRWFYNTYATADGFIALAAPGRLRALLADVLGIDDPTLDPEFQMPDDPRALLAKLTSEARAAVATFSTANLLDLCTARGVPAAPIRFVEEAVTDENARLNGFVESFDHPVVGPVTMPTVPVGFSRAKYEAARTTPAYGEHTREVLSALGYSAAEIVALVKSRAVGLPETSPFNVSG
jgi:crotonobetainyl-CoA:carnitine CoA-transferase CaiB-like acyl-CoA transferase